jgi:large subunit ribosomal protein L6
VIEPSTEILKQAGEGLDLRIVARGYLSMSRIGRKPVPVPANVKVALADSTIGVEGPKGKLSYTYRKDKRIDVAYDEAGKQIVVTRGDDERQSRALHGLTRSLIANMVTGVTTGYIKKLEIVGVGYQAQLKKANTVALQVGYANQVVLEAPAGVSVAVPDATHVTISGADKQAVGQFAAVVRKVRPPEPYKGKGIRYEGEVVRRKAGKAFGSK